MGATTRRRIPLPPDWAARKAAVHARDNYQCTLLVHGTRCPYRRPDGTKLACDHIGADDDHSLDNLRTLCPRHHDTRTGKQGRAASAANAARRHRPSTQHPGITP